MRVAERLEVADAALRAGERLGLGRRADELLEPLADAAVVRAELARRERLLRLVPEQHVDVRRLEPLDPRDLLAVEAELEDVGGLRVAGELGVERLVAPRAERGGRLDAHQEVGLPAPAVAREDALVDDVDAVPHRLDGLARGALPVAVGLELDRPDRLSRLDERAEVGVLVLEPLAEDELGLLVLDVRLGELLLRDLEREGREVAAAEVGRDVGGREGDVVVLELHCLSIYFPAARSYERSG